jgi:hypothetical protein
MTDLDTIRERHELGNINGCSLCAAGVDCDTRVVLDALERADAASVDDAAALQEAVAIYDREAAHAKALAEALRHVTGATHDGKPPLHDCDTARTALAAYDTDHER